MANALRQVLQADALNDRHFKVSSKSGMCMVANGVTVLNGQVELRAAGLVFHCSCKLRRVLCSRAICLHVCPNQLIRDKQQEHHDPPSLTTRQQFE